MFHFPVALLTNEMPTAITIGKPICSPNRMFVSISSAGAGIGVTNVVARSSLMCVKIAPLYGLPKSRAKCLSRPRLGRIYHILRAPPTRHAAPSQKNRLIVLIFGRRKVTKKRPKKIAAYNTVIL